MNTRFQAPFFKGRKPRVIAHRGSSGTYPENTLLSFVQAVNDGADVLELDVHLSADGQVVVLHDRTVDRTTDGEGLVHEHRFEALRQLDAGYKFSCDGGLTFPFRGKGIAIPTLEEVIEACPSMPLNIELKSRDSRLVSAVAAILEGTGKLDSVLLSSTDNRQMRSLRSRMPISNWGFSRREALRFLLRTWLRLPFVFGKMPAPVLQLPLKYKGWTVVLPSVVRAAHRFGMEIHVWTVNDQVQMQRLLKMGVDGIITDHPAVLRRLVNQF